MTTASRALAAWLALALLLTGTGILGAERPNIVLVITDDQGYGDLGCTGNPVVKTPHIDRLASESTSLTNYHVAPTCSPTRAALLTGHWTNRTGVWHTINGRSMLRADEITLGQLLKDHGYATGMFGKWHLGDNYPYRPEDRGFTEVYRHGGGGVGQTPDVWNNAYFDGAYFHNGHIEPAQGFCTDVFFQQAARFIRDCAARGQPFLAYIATNAPHGPLHTPPEYLQMYSDQPAAIAAFYGMITNIDDNVGRLRELLDDLGVAENTVFIFTTDNGTATGEAIYNAGMRGKKGSEYDGGHRVPFFVHWPAAGLTQRYENATLTHAVDIVPTLLEVAAASPPPGLRFDGRSIRALWQPGNAIDWPDRFLVTDSQRVRDPIKWKQSAVMSQRWRLVNGTELYDMQADPGQQQNVAARHPEQVAKMRAFYEAWWDELEPTFSQTTEIYLGHPEHPVVSLTAHDWIQESMPPWNQAHIREGGAQPRGRNRQAAREDKHEGHWAVKVLKDGEYELAVRRWPVEADAPIQAGLPPLPNVPGASQAFRARPGRAIQVLQAVLRLDGVELERKPVQATDHEIRFRVRLSRGSHQLAPCFITDEGTEVGAFYTIVSTAAAAERTQAGGIE